MTGSACHRCGEPMPPEMVCFRCLDDPTRSQAGSRAATGASADGMPPSVVARLHERALEIANAQGDLYFRGCECESCSTAFVDAVLEAGMRDV